MLVADNKVGARRRHTQPGLSSCLRETMSRRNRCSSDYDHVVDPLTRIMVERVAF